MMSHSRMHYSLNHPTTYGRMPCLGCMMSLVVPQKESIPLPSVTPHDGCVTCHTRHASVTDFRPIWGNTVEVAHMTSSVMYINSHTKGTSLPLARITTMIPLFEP